MTFSYKEASLFYTDQGSGPPLILLHGFLENHTMWDAFLPELTKTHRVLCLDLPGHGQSDCLNHIHSMELMAQVTKHLLDILQLDNVTIIGHSMGGYVGCAFAKAFPKNLNALCLLNSTPYEDPKERKALRISANTIASTQFEQLVRMSFINLFDPDEKNKYQIAIDSTLQSALKTSIQGYTAANKGMCSRIDSVDVFTKGSYYTGMILGRTDWIIDASSHQDRFESKIDFFTILETGHMSHITDTLGTQDAIFNFLKLIRL